MISSAFWSSQDNFFLHGQSIIKDKSYDRFISANVMIVVISLIICLLKLIANVAK